jgi:hypothetical protein
MKFSDYIKSLASLWGLLAGVVTLSPLFLLPGKFYPPWPDSGGNLNVVVGVVVCICGVVLAAMLEGSQIVLRRRSRVAMAGALVVVLIYVVLFGAFVVSETQQVNGQPAIRRCVSGSELRSGVHADQRKGDLLRAYGHCDSIWTEESILLRSIPLALSFQAWLILATLGAGLAARARRG